MFPSAFIGHGSPINAIEDNDYTQAWRNLGKSLPKPSAIMVISAHWFTGACKITYHDWPKTIYDFYGFPKDLNQISYPAPGHPELAKEIISNLAEFNIIPDTHWGFDHGTWTVLKHIFPLADIPVIQLSIDFTKPLKWHLELAQKLKFLREKNVFILGSGNIVHNLSMARISSTIEPYPWAKEFDEKVADILKNKDYNKLLDYTKITKTATIAIPTLDHFIPLIYVVGLAEEKEEADFICKGISFKSISMRSFVMV